MERWFVAVSKPNQEFRASYELLNQGFQTFIPTISLKPMFPRYLFLHFDRDRDPWGKVRSTRGCIDLLKSGFLPQPVPDPVMAVLMAYEDRIDEIPPDPVYSKGQLVKVTHGLLNGYEGLFQASAKNRTEALLEILGNRVSVPLKDIKAV